MKEGHIHTMPDGSTWIVRNQEMVRTTGTLQTDAKGHYVCVDCKTQYPANSEDIDGLAKCNGHKIDLCQWCRPDSQPWAHGRGI